MLGIVIRIGAGRRELVAPEGTTDLRPLTREQLGVVAGLVSEAADIRDRRRPFRRPRIRRNREAR